MGLFSSKPRVEELPESVRQKYRVEYKDDYYVPTLTIYNEADERIYANTVNKYGKYGKDYRRQADDAIRQHEKDGTVNRFGSVSYSVLPWEKDEEE